MAFFLHTGEVLSRLRGTKETRRRNSALRLCWVHNAAQKRPQFSALTPDAAVEPYPKAAETGFHTPSCTAASLCRDNDIPILVFSVDEPMNIYYAACGEEIGTLVKK